MTASSGSAAPANPSAPAPLTILLLTSRPHIAAALAARLAPSGATVHVSHGGRWPAGADPDVAVLDVPFGDTAALEQSLAVAARLRDGPVPVLALEGPQARRHRIALYRSGVLGTIGLEEDVEELSARLQSILAAKRSASAALRRLREYTLHLDEQLRLAQRLQMDFLPHGMPETAGGRFAARLEAAAWVAGDFYDIFRLDERHVGFYIADAVGHGIPAALLTVFVKRSLQTKRIQGKRYELIEPHEALRLLNADLLSAELHETPFITMVYGVFNETTRECAYARAGHPKPLLIKPDGTLDAIDGEGPLLGIFADAAFEPCCRRLEPGERLLLYSDGAERIDPDRRANPPKLIEIIQAAARRPVETMLDTVLDAVHSATAGEPLADDVTLVALELNPKP